MWENARLVIDILAGIAKVCGPQRGASTVVFSNIVECDLFLDLRGEDNLSISFTNTYMGQLFDELPSHFGSRRLFTEISSEQPKGLNGLKSRAEDKGKGKCRILAGA